MGKRFTMSLRGTAIEIEFIPRDRHGIRATRACHNGEAATRLLLGWFRKQGCPVLSLFDAALDMAAPEIAQAVQDWPIGAGDRRRLRFLRPQAALHGIELARSGKRPQEVIDLRRKIEAATQEAERRRVAEGRDDACANGGDEEIRAILNDKLALDRLYGDWMESATP